MPESPLYGTRVPLASNLPAGIVLCGGHSSRMGQPKASLDFHGQPLLARVVERLRSAVSHIIVVAAQSQDLPSLSTDVTVVRDPAPDLGPMQGFAAGLAAVVGQTDAVFLSACDVPFLRPAFVTRLAALRGDADVAIPIIEGKTYPLSAVYAVRLLPRIEKMLAERRLRMRSIAESSNARLVELQSLHSEDPFGESLININTPEEYAAALAREVRSELR